MQDKFSIPDWVTAVKKFASLTFNEKLAAGMFILFGPVFLITRLSYPNFESPIEGLLLALAWLLAHGIAVLIAIATVFFRPQRSGSDRRDLIGRFLPLAALLVTVVGASMINEQIWTHKMRTFAARNDHLLSGTAPKSVIYSEEIPDGGTAVIRSPNQNPTEFTPEKSLELVNGNLTSCDRLDDRDWFCWFG
ncbi:hypothetical protein LCM19_06305 [Qipengyuania flava]|nr:hypothetical protein [Qipengyuania flava]